MLSITDELGILKGSFYCMSLCFYTKKKKPVPCNYEECEGESDVDLGLEGENIF